MSKVIVSLPGGRAISTEELPPLATSVTLDYSRGLVEQLGKTDKRNYQLCTQPLVVTEEDSVHDLQVGDVVVNIADFGPRPTELGMS